MEILRDTSDEEGLTPSLRIGPSQRLEQRLHAVQIRLGRARQGTGAGQHPDPVRLSQAQASDVIDNIEVYL